MAGGAVEVRVSATGPGGVVLALILALTLGPVALVLIQAGGAGGLTAADWAAARFTVLQAALSAGLSVALAVPVARALARRSFPGRAALITALGAPFLLPVVVAVLGILALFGRSGLLNRGIEALGLPGVTIYGLQGVLLAHLFLNLPLAVRMILNGWAAVPPERFRLAQSLDFGPRDVLRVIERPVLRATLPGAFVAIFLVCLTSFTAVLVMGGGPRATTLSLAIYQSFRLEFDLAHAASLSALQMALGLVAAFAGVAFVSPAAFGAGRGWRGQARIAPPDPRAVARIGDGVAIGGMGLFLALPIGLAMAAGVTHLPRPDAALLAPLGRSVAVALGATLLAVAGALALGLALSGWRRGMARLADGAAMLVLGTSPLVLGTGAFLALRGWADPAAFALLVTMVANGLMALPFALRILLPDIQTLRADYDRLADSLGMAGLARLRLLVLPRLRRPLGFAAGLAAALAMGDLGVVTLFSDPDRATLPMVLYERMGQYRMDEAYGLAVVLVLASFGLFWLFDRMGRSDVDV